MQARVIVEIEIEDAGDSYAALDQWVDHTLLYEVDYMVHKAGWIGKSYIDEVEVTE